jgi:hypothetical protein
MPGDDPIKFKEDITMTISIDTSSVGYQYPGGYHGEATKHSKASLLGAKLKSVWSGEEKLVSLANHNSEVSELFSKGTTVPVVPEINSEARYQVDHEKVISLVS